MKFVARHRNWFFAVVATSSLAAVAGLSYRGSASAQQDTAASAHAERHVTAFRDVTQKTLPGIVFIETRGKAVELTSESSLDPSADENSPLRRFFGDDPRFKEFFEQLPQQRQRRQAPRSHAVGSGFVIDESGIIMTNSHVVRDADRVTVTLQDGREFTATDIRQDPFSDVAIIRIGDVKGLKALPLGDSQDMEIGDWVLAMGAPFGLRGSVTAGIISAKGRGPGITQRENFLQTDAAINPGNSGGPLVNLNGEVIGINTAISTRSGGYDGVGFAIPVNMAKWVSQQLIENGKVRRAFLGVSIQAVDNELAAQFGATVGNGAIVSQVMPDSPAAKANLEAGDVITTFNGRAISGPRSLQNIVEQLEAGKSYDLTVLRNGEKQQLSVTLGDLPQKLALAGGASETHSEPAPTKNTFSEIGIEVQDMTPAVAQQLGFTTDIEGVFVSQVDADSPAYDAGIRTGQIIQKVGSQSIATTEEFRAAMKDLSVEKGILMLVRSTKGSRFVVVEAN